MLIPPASINGKVKFWGIEYSTGFPLPGLAASIRNLEHLNQALTVGTGAATLPGKLLDQVLHHDLTDKGLEIFESDWKKSGLVI